MTATSIPRYNVWQDGGATFLARLYGAAGALVNQATFNSIICNIFEITSTTPTTPTSTRNLTIAGVVFNTLQTDNSWTADLIGYNFADVVPNNGFPTRQATYRVEYQFTTVALSVFWLAYEVHALRTFTNG